MELAELQAELRIVESKIDLLHEVCGCGLYAEITQTVDGFFLGRREGEIGFNNLLGKPSSNAIKRTRGYLRRLSEDGRELAIHLLARFDIDI